VTPPEQTARARLSCNEGRGRERHHHHPRVSSCLRPPQTNARLGILGHARAHRLRARPALPSAPPPPARFAGRALELARLLPRRLHRGLCAPGSRPQPPSTSAAGGRRRGSPRRDDRPAVDLQSCKAIHDVARGGPTNSSSMSSRLTRRSSSILPYLTTSIATIRADCLAS